MTISETRIGTDLNNADFPRPQASGAWHRPDHAAPHLGGSFRARKAQVRQPAAHLLPLPSHLSRPPLCCLGCSHTVHTLPTRSTSYYRANVNFSCRSLRSNRFVHAEPGKWPRGAGVMHPLSNGRLAAFEAMGGAAAHKADAGMGASVGKGKGKAALSERPQREDRVPAGTTAAAAKL